MRQIEMFGKASPPKGFDDFWAAFPRREGKLDAMRAFQAAIKTAYELFARVYDEYGHRARKAETNEGIDWKALSHAVRVAREALELLETGRITFPLPYAAHILEIKTGALTYDAVAGEIEGLLEDVERASAISALPDKPDFQFMDDLIVSEYGSA